MSKFAWVTLATNDSYSLGALVLANSLKRANTGHQLVVLITPGVSNAMRERLQSVFNVVEEVNVLDSQDSANLALLARPELGITFTKLHCWRLVQFEKCVFLDADTLVLQNCDELFEREELSAAPDVGWPDCFNSGVFVYRPNLDTYAKLIDFAVKQGSFDGGDQGLLNLFFSDWAHRDIAKHLPFIYNTCSTACYSYLPAFKKFGQNVKILHFIGAMKPWLQSFDSKSGQVNIPSGSEHVAQYLQFWWTIFFQHVHRDLTAEMAGIAGALSHVTLGAGKSPEQEAYEHQMRRQFWEAGNIDYMGKDSFDNIWARISKTIDNVPAAAETSTETAPAPAAAAPVAAAPAPAAAAAPKPAAAEAAPKKSPTGQVNETVEEETVKIQERVIKTKTPDGKTVLTKITTLPGEEIEEIEEETTETVDGETKTNKTKSQVVKSPFPVSKLPNGKEIPIKGNMKEGDVVTDFDEETKTTIVTKRLANGYEQAFSTVTPEGNNKSWTKTFFDPVAVEGDEEEEEIEEYEEVETHGGNRKKTTTETTAPAGAVKAPAPVAKAPAPAAKAPAPAPATTPAAGKKPGQTTVVKNVPHGKQEITTTVDKDGKQTTKTHTMTDLPNEAEEYEEYEETHITEQGPKKKSTTTTTTKPGVPQQGKKQEVVPAKNTTTTVAVPSAKNPKDNVLARKVVSKGEEEIQITEEHTETEFSPSKKTTKTSTIVPSTGEKLDPKGKTTVTQVVIPGSQNTVVTKSNEQDGKQIVVKKGPSGSQNISKTTSPDGSTKVQVTTTVNPEELHIEETETTNIIGDKTITTTRTEVPIPGKKIVTKLPPQKVEGAGVKTKTTTTTTTMPVGVDRKTTTTKRVDNGTEVSVKTETKDGKTRLESRTKFDPIYHPAVSDEEEVEEYEEETQTFAPVKTKTTTTSRVPADGSKKKPDAASSESPAAAPTKKAEVKGAKK